MRSLLGTVISVLFLSCSGGKWDGASVSGGQQNGPPLVPVTPIGLPLARVTPIGTFLVYAQRSVNLGAHDLVSGGDIGVRTPAASNFTGQQLAVSDFAHVDAAHDLLSPSVFLGKDVQVGDIDTNALTNTGAHSIGTVAPFAPSTMPLMPLALAPSSSGLAVHVSKHGSRALTPGAYGPLTMDDHSDVTLSAGEYSFASVQMGEHSQFLGSGGPVVVRIAGTLSVADFSTFAPASGGTAGDLAIFVSANDTTCTVAASIGAHGHVTTVLVAPNGTLTIGDHVQALGAFAGFDVSVADHVDLDFQSGISGALSSPQGTQPIPGEVPPAIAAGSVPLVGKLPGDSMVTLAIGLPLQNQAALEALIPQLYDPSSPNYRKYLTPTEFGTAFGPPAADYASLQSFATANGLTIVDTYASRAMLSVTASAATIEAAFFVSLNLYARPDGTTFYAPANDPSANLATPILHISGFDSFAVPNRAGGIGPNGCPLNASENNYAGNDFRNAYFPGTPLRGSGQTIALYEPDSFLGTDLQQYVLNYLPGQVTCTVTGCINVNPIQVPTGALPFTPGANEFEVALDIEMLLAMAPQATIRVYERDPSSAFNPDLILTQIANDLTHSQVISNSWTWNQGTLDANIPNIFKQYAVQGQSFFQASGDLGAYSSMDPLPLRNVRPGVPEPMIYSPLMTVVGGTILTSKLATDSPPTEYLSEATWNNPQDRLGCTFAAPCKSASGGGFADGYMNPGTLVTYSPLAIPSYQVNVNPGNTEVTANPSNARMIPDVSMIADQVVIYAEDLDISSPTFGTAIQKSCIHGTSVATPLWAAATALANQASGIPPIGFANPTLYRLASASSASYAANFHDVNDNSSNNYVAPGLYHASMGYDLATGLGSPQLNLLGTLPPQSCMPGTALSALISGANVTAYVPDGSYSEDVPGVRVVPIEGTGTAMTISTPAAVNSCAGNSLTGEVVCIANNTDVYIIHGTSITQTLNSGATGFENSSGGRCQTCSVAIDPLHNQAFISIATGSGAAIERLDLATSTFATPVQLGQQASAEDIVVDTIRGLVLSPNEEFENEGSGAGNYQLVNTTNGAVFNFTPAGSFPGDFHELDSAAEDCTTGIALAAVEFTNQVLLVDLTQATFTGTSWTAPSQFQVVSEFDGFSAGVSGISVAPNSHLGVASGEFGGTQFGAFVLPSTAGSGTPTPSLVDWVEADMPNTPDGKAWSMGRDPHALTAYTSPANLKQYAIFEDDVNQDGTRTFLAVVDLQALLVLPRVSASVNKVAAPLTSCRGPGVNGTPAVAGCIVRFLP